MSDITIPGGKIRSFVERITRDGLDLPYHVARKQIPYVDAAGTLVRPEDPNGYKFETFVFDALPLAERTLTQEVARDEEFAPIKNASGNDSPQTAQRALIEQYGRWLREAGVEVPVDRSGRVAGAIEISPLFALDCGECVARLRARPAIRFRDGLVLSDGACSG